MIDCGQTTAKQEDKESQEASAGVKRPIASPEGNARKVHMVSTPEARRNKKKGEVPCHMRGRVEEHVGNSVCLLTMLV